MDMKFQISGDRLKNPPTKVLVKTDTGRADFIDSSTAIALAVISRRLKIFHRGLFCHPGLIMEFYQLSPFFTYFHLFLAPVRTSPKEIVAGDQKR